MLSENWQKLKHQQLTPNEKKRRKKRSVREVSNDFFAEFRKRPGKSLEVTLLQPDTQLLTGIKQVARVAKLGQFVALDCEFVGTGPNGRVSQLGRVSIVDYYGCVILDEFVKPRGFVTDWRTPYSGLEPSMLRKAIPFQQARHRVQTLFDGRKVVGHAIANDFRALEFSLLPEYIDTQHLKRWSDSPDIRKRPGLRKLLTQLLGLEIQRNVHDSVEDARASMLIFRLFKNEFLNRK